MHILFMTATDLFTRGIEYSQSLNQQYYYLNYLSFLIEWIPRYISKDERVIYCLFLQTITTKFLQQLS